MENSLTSCSAVMCCMWTPYLPLLDLQDFLGAIERNDGANQISLILFQAVMFASTAYVDIGNLTAEGYANRKAARRNFFHKVKVRISGVHRCWANFYSSYMIMIMI